MLARLTQLSRRMFLRARTLLPKKRLGVVGSFLVSAVVVLGVFGVVDVLFAQEEMITWVMNGVISALSWAMFIIARLCIGLTIFFLKFFVEVATYNNYIDTPTVKVGWFLVRDVANMFFVVLLLVISFGTILGVEQYEWKKTLGKLVFAAIFINFSNTIAQLIIDVAQVFTITFVNAISATAGGNIITMFNIDTVYKITGAEELGIGGNIRLETFGASVAVFLMALLMAVTIGAYALVMVARMVVLWVLIIVSPLAYIFQVIPQTQKYAQEWWSQFINHVIVAPVMVFFVWLAFATLSAPQQYLNLNADTFEEANSALEGQTYKLSISEATSWQNLANYIIAIAFLLVGLRKVRELGVEAGGLTSSATGFAKKVAGYATGYVVGRAAYDVGKAGLKKAGKFGFDKMPLGGDFWKRRGRGVKAFVDRKMVTRNITRNERMADLEKSLLDETDPSKKSAIQAKIWKERIKGELTGGLFGETMKRKDKRMKDWEVGVERLKEAEEESYSTSSTEGGQFKTLATATKKSVLEMAEKKGAQKIAEKEQQGDDMIGHMRDVFVEERLAQKIKEKGGDEATDELAKAEEAYAGAETGHAQAVRRFEEAKKEAEDASDPADKAEKEEKMKGAEQDMKKSEATRKTSEDAKNTAEVAKKKIENEQRNELLKEFGKQMNDPDSNIFKGKEYESLRQTAQARFFDQFGEKERPKAQELIKRGGGIESIAELGRVRTQKQGIMAKASAQTEQINESLQYKKDLLVAEARDKEAIAKGDVPRFVRLVQQEFIEKKNKQLSGLNFREMTESARHFTREMRTVAKRGDTATPEERAAALINNYTGLAANIAKGTENGGQVLNYAAEELELEPIIASNVNSVQSHILSILLGEKIGTDNVALDAAFKKFIDTVGNEDQAHNMMRQLDGAIKAMAADGGTIYAGAFDDTDYDPKTGRTTFKRANQNFHNGAQKYWAQDVNVSKITGLSDTTGKKIVSAGDGKKATVMSIGSNKDKATDADKAHFAASLATFQQMFGNITLPTKLHTRFIESLENDLISDNATVFEGTAETRKQFLELLATFGDKNESAGQILALKLENVLTKMSEKMSDDEKKGSTPEFAKVMGMLSLAKERYVTGKKQKPPSASPTSTTETGDDDSDDDDRGVIDEQSATDPDSE